MTYDKNVGLGDMMSGAADRELSQEVVPQAGTGQQGTVMPNIINIILSFAIL